MIWTTSIISIAGQKAIQDINFRRRNAVLFGNNNNDEQDYYNDADYERRTDSYDNGYSDGVDYNMQADSAEIVAKFNPYLLPGERVYWVGKTVKGGGKGVKTGANPGRFMGIFFVAFALIWISGTMGIKSFTSRVPGGSAFDAMAMIFPLFGVLFLIVGIVMIVGKTPDSCYAITDQRVLTITNNRFSAGEISKISNVTVSMGNNGIGTVSFVNMNMMMYSTFNAFDRHTPRNIPNVGYHNIPSALYSVADAQNAYRILSGLVMNNQNRMR